MLAVAGGLGTLLLVGMGGWALMGGRPSTIPVIEADSRPLRVKPADAGGMQVAGSDEAGDGGGVQAMAPAAEAPAPQALRAQLAPVVAPNALPAAVAGPAPAIAAVTPVVQPPSARPGVVPPVARATVGGAFVQLAALETEALAQAEWQRLVKRMPELLGDRKPVVLKAERDGKVVWRIRTGGFADIAEATGFCVKVKARGAGCTLASF